MLGIQEEWPAVARRPSRALRPLTLVLCAALLAGASGCGPTVREDTAASGGAAAGEEVEAWYRRGLAYATGEGVDQDHREALRWFERAAGQGHAGAQYLTGIAYYTGRGVPRDQARGVRWFERAAASGHARAQYQLGDAYLNGRGVARDAAWAAMWLGKAAQQGNAAAQFNLGVVYAAGLGVPVDDVQAVRWLTLAERGGRDDARPALEKVSQRLTAPERERADALVRRRASPREPAVRYVQAGLARAGFPAGGVDGIAGERTASAVRAYRKARRLPPGDAIDDALVDRLRRESASS